MDEHEAAVAVVGGSLGGVAAALAAAEAGADVVLTAETDWLGGQLTAQGVSAPDEHEHVEQFGGTRAYEELRERIRARYRERHDVEPSEGPLNPGNCWVSGLGFEPAVGVEVIESMLAPHVDAGRLTVLREHDPADATVSDGRVTRVALAGPDGDVGVRADYVLDATELGDLLPLTDTEYVTGAEPRDVTGEPAAPEEPRPDEMQAFTYTFAVEHRPGEDHTVERPEGYERFREEQPYTFIYDVHVGETSTYRMFERGPEGELPFWTYRRLLDADQFADVERDVAMINWSGNDYRFATVVDQPPERRAEILDEARRLARGFLYWLQTDAPRDDGEGTGYPGLRLLPEVMDAEDGLSKRPYVRESRRVVPERRVVQSDVAASHTEGARATPMPDSVGVGLYAIDIHGCVGNADGGIFEPTRPFQIPLGALVPADGPSNLLPACKNIGTTHVTNGCYRLHPVEWNVGEAAGALAAHCLGTEATPETVWTDDHRRRVFQRRLLRRGVPLAWTTDVPPDHDLFVPTGLLAVEGAIPNGSPRAARLDVRPDEPLTRAERWAVASAGLSVLGRGEPAGVEAALADAGVDLPAGATWREACEAFRPRFEATLAAGA